MKCPISSGGEERNIGDPGHPFEIISSDGKVRRLLSRAEASIEYQSPRGYTRILIRVSRPSAEGIYASIRWVTTPSRVSGNIEKTPPERGGDSSEIPSGEGVKYVPKAKRRSPNLLYT
jgi:hypothetical protein